MIRGVLKAREGAERDAAEKAVMFVCNRVPDPEHRAELLHGVLAQLSENERVALLPMLGRVGGRSALPTIEAALADNEPRRRAAGLRALCNWPDASVASRLPRAR